MVQTERDRADNKNNDKIINNGRELKEVTQIIQAVYDYYKNLYSSQTADTKNIEKEIGDTPKLAETDRRACEGLITYDE